MSKMLMELRERVYQANLAIHRAGLVTLTFGNVSGRDPESGLVVIKPSGVGYQDLAPGNMVVVDLEGRVMEGEFQPSVDTPSHLTIYRAFPQVGGIVHTHSTHATVWAQANRPLPCYGTTHADHFHGEVPVTRSLTEAELTADYEAATGAAIVEAFRGKDPLSVPAALVANHGPFVWGRTPEEAATNSVALEEVARMAILTESLRPGVPPAGQGLVDKHFLRKHGPGAYYGQKRR